MELKIFDSILFEDLRPWLLSLAEIKIMTDNLRKAANTVPATLQEINTYTEKILANKPVLCKWLKQQKPANDSALINLLYDAELPEFSNAITKYYATLIEKETQRIFNSFTIAAGNRTSNVLKNYHTELVLRQLKHLVKTASKEIRNQGYEDTAQNNMPVVPFVLYYLKYSLIALYFSIQEDQKKALENQISLNDFYLLELQEPKDKISPLYYRGKETKASSQGKGMSKKLSFGFRGDKQKLRVIIVRLCDEISLLDENQSPADELVTLLTAKEIKPGKIKIYLGCDNKNFRRVLEKLMPDFEDLSFINIQHSESFHSKKGKLLVSNDFSKAKTFTPKLKETIDNIFSQLQ